MPHRTSIRRSTLVSLAATLMLLALPASAGAEDGAWKLRFGGVWVEPDVTFDEETDPGVRGVATVDSDVGWGLSLERRFNRRVGLELGIFAVKPEITVTLTDVASGFQIEASDGIGFRPLTLGLNIHLGPESRTDFYLGPMVAWAAYGDFNFILEDENEAFSSDNDFGWGAIVGADVGLGRSIAPSWSLSIAVRYLDTSLEVTDDDGDKRKLSFDPFMVTFGFVFGF